MDTAWWEGPLRVKIGIFILSMTLITLQREGRAQTPLDRRALVLVPGTLNSLVPGGQIQLPGGPSENPYFSKAIFETLREFSLSVEVIKNLRWFGELHHNGEEVYQEMKQWYKREFPHGQVPITLIAHSAGGLYALWAIHLNELHRGQSDYLPIQKLVMISTPLHGVELANLVFSGGKIGRFIEEVLEKWGPYLDFRGLLQMTTSRVNDFLKGLQIPKQLKIYSLAGSQKPPPFPGNPLSSPFLAPPFVMTDMLIQRLSDGVVSVDSTRPRDLFLRDFEGEEVSIQFIESLHPILDHAEQILDVQYLRLMGIQNLDYVRTQQKELYRNLLKL